jgi:hypothetical protein
MKTHKTRVSNTPWKLGVLETSQRQFRRETKNIVKYVPVTLKLAYETHVETWLRSRLRTPFDRLHYIPASCDLAACSFINLRSHMW